MAPVTLSPWFDPTHVQAVRDSFPEWMALVFAAVSFLGSVYVVAPVVLVAYWFLDRRRFGPWIAVVAGGYAVMAGIKSLFGVPRPGVGPAISPDALPFAIDAAYASQVHVTDASFPSGHALAATVIWTMLALELDVGSRRQRFAGAGAMISLVALSRLANGLHYPIDVVGGIAIGLVYVGAMLALMSWVDRSRPLGSRTGGPLGSRTGRSLPSPTVVAFGVVAILATVSVSLTGGTTEAALVGVALGGMLGWRLPEFRWPPLRRGAGYGFVGGLALGVVGFAVGVAHLVPFVTGLLAGTAVVGLPGVLETRSDPLSVRLPK